MFIISLLAWKFSSSETLHPPNPQGPGCKMNKHLFILIENYNRKKVHIKQNYKPVD
ncbi:hypothetical protein V6Z11_D02G028800 [Gossypium hirsutum]